MPTTISAIRANARRDLHDEDSANYRWSDAELDRHILRAVRELSLASPREVVTTLVTVAGSRDLSTAGITDIVTIEAVEYPIGKYPPIYVSFSLWGSALTLLVDNTPSGGESVKVYYGQLHTLDASSSTIPTALDDLVATGAAAYAALEWSSFATNRVNVGGEDTWRHYLTWGQERLAAFMRGLATHSRKSRVRVRRLYRPARPGASQSTDWGP